MGRPTFIKKQFDGERQALKIKLFGDWEKTIKIFNKLSPEIKKCSLKAQMKICENVKKRVKNHLIYQDLGWKSLDAEYSYRKMDKGLDSRTLIAYSSYYNAIDAWTIGNQHIAMVGVRSGIYTKKLHGSKNPVEVAKIATMHEFSSGKRLPKRPLWNPTISEMGGKAGIEKLYMKHFIATLRRNGIPIKNLKGYI